MTTAGVNAAPADIPATLAAYPGMTSCRVFAGPGEGIPAWTDPAMAALRKAGVTAWPSFKDWPSDARALPMVNTWLDTLPSDVAQVWLTYHHEPEGDLDADLYRARWIRLGRAVRAHRFRDRVRLVPIHTLYPARHKIGDQFSPYATAWVAGDWHRWSPTDQGRYVGDYMGWDCYLESTARAYEPPHTFLAIPTGSAMCLGVPLVVPELGALRLAGDESGTGRAEWIDACLAHLRRHGAVTVNWWNALGSAGQDYRLTDAPSAAAWRRAVGA